MKNQLVEISPETALSVFTADKGLDSYVQQVTEEVNCFKHDLTTAAGRARTISLASKVAKIKVKYDDCGKDLVSGWKESARKVDKARKKMRDELDELKVLARKPVTDWEVEQERIEYDRLAKIEFDILKAKIESDHEIALLLNEKLDREITEENARIEAAAIAETARLKQAQIDNDARIARQAADHATAEAERLAQKAIDDAQAAKQKAIDDKIKADNDLLESQAREKRLTEQAAQEKINQQWLAIELDAHAINDKMISDVWQKNQQELAEKARIASIETERLAGIERQRLAQKAIDDEAARKLADVNHVRIINRAIYKSFIDAGLTNECATLATQALIDNKVSHTAINY
jgi:colicin import membrane protein